MFRKWVISQNNDANNGLVDSFYECIGLVREMGEITSRF
jgi:hypothetical protein